MSPGRAAVVSMALLALGWAAPGRAPAAADTRAPILAGSWYPADAGALAKTIEGFLDDASGESRLEDASGDAPIAVIVPHAGYAYSGATAGHGFAAVRGRSYKRIIILGPSHNVFFTGAVLTGADEKYWQTPLGVVPLDTDAIAGLAQDGRDLRRIPAAHEGEHSLEIEIPFLQVALAPGFRIIPILVGDIDDESTARIAAKLRPLIGPGTLVVVSSDFTHYGPNYRYVPFADSVAVRLTLLDHGAIDLIRHGSARTFEDYRARTGATICGAEPIRVLLELLGAENVRCDEVGYAQSGSIVGDYTNSVSYAAVVFTQRGAGGGEGSGRETDVIDKGRLLNANEQKFLVTLARAAIEAKLRGTKAPDTRVPEDFAPDSPLREVRGVFVTLTAEGRLRGCIGAITGTEPLVQGAAHQALNSAFEDPRFPPLSKGELDQIHIEISVLTPPAPIGGPDEIEVGRHGVFIEKRGRRAVFLPQVATEQGWDRDTMLRYLCRKAGLGADEWKKDANFEVFEAQIIEEPESN
jgi:MEMO1 family protein